MCEMKELVKMRENLIEQMSIARKMNKGDIANKIEFAIASVDFSIDVIANNLRSRKSRDKIG